MNRFELGKTPYWPFSFFGLHDFSGLEKGF
jgi:hypothetical protein